MKFDNGKFVKAKKLESLRYGSVSNNENNNLNINNGN